MEWLIEQEISFYFAAFGDVLFLLAEEGDRWRCGFGDGDFGFVGAAAARLRLLAAGNSADFLALKTSSNTNNNIHQTNVNAAFGMISTVSDG